MIAVRVRKPARIKAATAADGPRLCGCGVRVGEEERRHLIEACAFFKAEHFRMAEPGSIREQDVRKAAADVDAALKGRGKLKSQRFGSSTALRPGKSRMRTCFCRTSINPRS